MGNPQDPRAFEVATDAAAAQGSAPIDKICAPCQGNWIKIRYEYEDGTGVPDANYVVQTVTGDGADDGTPTGDIIAEGQTDANGDAHVPLPDEHTRVEFYFHDEPEGEPYVDPEAQQHVQEHKPGFWSRLWSNITEGADFVWDVLKGDFEENPSTSEIIARMILTMIPGIDQLADAQDIIHILYKLIWKKEYDEKWNWILLVITLIGLVPTLGSLAKGLLKLVFKKFGDISALRALYGVFNFFGKGNAHRWLRDFANNLTGSHLNAALAQLDTMMARVVQYMTQSKGWLSGRWNRLVDQALLNVAAFRSVAPQKLREAASDLQQKLLSTIAAGMTRIQRKATKNAEPYVVKQEKIEPPNRLRRLSKREEYLGATPRKNSRTGREVRERMREEGTLRTNRRGQDEFFSEDTGQWHLVDSPDTHMGHHPEDAVDWWNREGYKHGPKSQTVRDFMLDSDNYRFEHGPSNSARGGATTSTYRDPL